MLAEIQCKFFRAEVIRFHQGLNVIVGDPEAANSIGKSTLLMIIDFVFGGNTFIEHNSDVVAELGHHSYRFKLIVGGQLLEFERSTKDHKFVSQISKVNELNKKIDLKTYNEKLKLWLGPSSPNITFRAAVGHFSRVWGKGNLEVDEPLHAHAKTSGATAINDLLKLYGEYESIRAADQRLKGIKDELSALRKSFHHKLSPKIGVRKYKENISTIETIDEELTRINQEFKKYALDLREVASRDVLEAQENKDNLISKKIAIEQRLKRLNKDITGNRFIRTRLINELKEIFPTINEERLLKIEEFHSELSKALKQQLLQSSRSLKKQLESIQVRIDEEDSFIEESLSEIKNPKNFVDRIYRISKSQSIAKEENRLHEHENELANLKSDSQKKLDYLKKEKLNKVETVINNEIELIISKIYDEHQKSPILKLYPNKYTFEVYEDTGTGKAYSNLLVLDLSIFNTTSLPFLIHDTPLFKNIENQTVAKLFQIYTDTSKQSFIAIDEIQKYGADAMRIIEEYKVINLDDDNVLFIRDWRDSK